ncbi:MAG: stage II sporulation protein M [Bacilli bacterium]|nr:stage II sporulation protein M [Bacilli bacterium]
MKEMYNNYKRELSKKNNLIILVLIVFLIGLIFGSIYITILSNDQKTLVLKQVTSFFNGIEKTSFSNKIDIFKNSLYSNLLYITIMWLLGISVIGIPIIFIMVFFKSFILGFSISSIFAKYGIKGLIKVLLYLIPANIVMIIFIIFLSSYSILISTKIFTTSFKKQTINFKTFMGKYFFILILGILFSILCSLYDAFINPFFYKIIY